MENYEFKFPKNKAFDEAGRGIKTTNPPSNKVYYCCSPGTFRLKEIRSSFP